jgi:competence protein ComEA
MADLPRRPAAARSGLSTAVAWAQWFGVSRLVAAAVSVLVVVAGGYWLVRSPPPSTEAILPVATTTIDVVADTSPGPSMPDPVIVHVVGAVRVPGVYELPPGSRVVAAVEAAGGPEPLAVLDQVNLAALLADGQRVHIPVEGEAPLPAFDADQSSAGAPGWRVGLEHPIDLNRAAVGELVRLPGVGEATATAIVVDRERNGPFASVDDLVRVRGIGPAKLEAVREFVVVR